MTCLWNYPWRAVGMAYMGWYYELKNICIATRTQCFSLEYCTAAIINAFHFISQWHIYRTSWSAAVMHVIKTGLNTGLEPKLIFFLELSSNLDISKFHAFIDTKQQQIWMYSTSLSKEREKNLTETEGNIGVWEEQAQMLMHQLILLLLPPVTMTVRWSVTALSSKFGLLHHLWQTL